MKIVTKVLLYGGLLFSWLCILIGFKIVNLSGGQTVVQIYYYPLVFAFGLVLNIICICLLIVFEVNTKKSWKDMKYEDLVDKNLSKR